MYDTPNAYAAGPALSWVLCFAAVNFWDRSMILWTALPGGGKAAGDMLSFSVSFPILPGNPQRLASRWKRPAGRAVSREWPLSECALVGVDM